MRPGFAASHSFASCDEVKKERSYTSSHPMCHVGKVRDTFFSRFMINLKPPRAPPTRSESNEVLAVIQLVITLGRSVLIIRELWDLEKNCQNHLLKWDLSQSWNLGINV
jgi:hypothetical protein